MIQIELAVGLETPTPEIRDQLARYFVRARTAVAAQPTPWVVVPTLGYHLKTVFGTEETDESDRARHLLAEEALSVGRRTYTLLPREVQKALQNESELELALKDNTPEKVQVADKEYNLVPFNLDNGTPKGKLDQYIFELQFRKSMKGTASQAKKLEQFYQA